MKIYLGADHGGFELKNRVKEYLVKQDVEVVDCGASSLDPQDDYPDYAHAVATKVAADISAGADPQKVVGILLCRSGGGMVIAANKVAGVRAVEVSRSEEAGWARNDDHANVMSLAADWIDVSLVEDIINAFLHTSFGQDQRYQRRVAKITEIEGAEK